MKALFLARKDGQHYHTDLICGMISIDYNIITTKEALERKLLPCPFCKAIKTTNKEKAIAHELGFDSGLTLGLTCSIQHAKTMLKAWKDLRELVKDV